jgi:hypothetical protein
VLAPLHLATLFTAFHSVFATITLGINAKDATHSAGRGTNRSTDDTANRPSRPVTILCAALSPRNGALRLSGDGQRERRKDQGGGYEDALHWVVFR